MNEFLWKPGEGVGGAALARMLGKFVRPPFPMGEAWFMGTDRYRFTSLLGDLDGVPLGEVLNALGEIASGTACFGKNFEWDAWYHYLLPRLIPGNREGYTIELLITGFISLHPHGIGQAPAEGLRIDSPIIGFISAPADCVINPNYDGFADDVLNTLGRCLMDAECWSDGGLVLGTILHRYAVPRTNRWGWTNASGDFSASMVFCLKYLPTDLLEGWLESLLKIESPHWRAQVLVWFIGARRLITESGIVPSDFESADGAEIFWEWSHCLSKRWFHDASETGSATDDFMPARSRELAVKTLRAYFTEERFFTWLLSISEIPSLHAEVGDLPFAFWDIYIFPAT